MTVSTSYAPIEVAWTLTNQAVSVTWPFLDDSLVVTEIDEDGVETEKTLTTHYTVSGGTDADGLPATGTVTMVGAATSGSTLRIERDTTLTQGKAWSRSGAFDSKALEGALDKSLLIAQEHDTRIDGLSLIEALAADFETPIAAAEASAAAAAASAAAAAATLAELESLAGVTSFNGRSGSVTPAANDYAVADINGLSAALAAKLDDLQATSAGLALLGGANAAAQRTSLGLGTSAVLDVGTTANKVVQLDGSAKMPAVDGSQLTNIPTGKIIQRAYAENTTRATITALIPIDNSIPQSNEGVEILSAVITPLSATNRIRLRAVVSINSDSTYPFCIGAAFKSGSSDAIAGQIIDGSGAGGTMDLQAEFVAGSTAAITVSVRVGAYYSGQVYVNGRYVYQEIGAVQNSTLIVEEISP